MAARDGRPLLLIDIAVPRDVDPAVREIDSVHLYDIDDLQSVVEANLRARMKEVASVEAMVEEEATRFLDWARSLDVVPTIAALRRQAEEMRAAELAKTLAHLPDLTEEEKEHIEALSTGHRQEDPAPSHRAPEVEGVRPSLRRRPPASSSASTSGRRTPDVPARRTIRRRHAGQPACPTPDRRRPGSAQASATPTSRFEVRTLRTTGDRRTREPLTSIGGKGVFVKELETALLAGGDRHGGAQPQGRADSRSRRA